MEYAGAAGGFIDKYGYPFCRGRIFETIEKDHQQYDDENLIFRASGACFFLRKEVYRKLNGFDGDFFAHQEEIDLCWRIRNTGNMIFYAGNATVYHLGGGTLHKSSAQKTYLNFRNNLCMLVKNLPKSKLFPIIFIRLFLDGIAGIQFLFQGKFMHTIAIIRAHFAFYRRVPKKYANRQKNVLNKYYLHKSMLTQSFLNNGMFFDR
jgi:GT2 family glycosyltransferase